MTSLFAIGLADLEPSGFSWKAALIVGAIAAIAVVAVVALAVATPFVALAAGATVLGTAITIGAIAICVGVATGAAAGFHWGGLDATEWEEETNKIAAQSGELHIFFVASANDATRASEFECKLVIYDEINIQRHLARKRTQHITAQNATEFYSIIGKEMEKWFGTAVLNDNMGLPRNVMIYMIPNPGEGIYERLKEMASNLSQQNVIVKRIEESWETAQSK